MNAYSNDDEKCIREKGKVETKPYRYTTACLYVHKRNHCDSRTLLFLRILLYVTSSLPLAREIKLKSHIKNESEKNRERKTWLRI